MSFPRIYCVSCKQLNQLTITELGDGPIAIYSCPNCGIVVDPPGKQIIEIRDGENGLQKIPVKSPQIKSEERCDKCRVAANIQAVLPSGFDLWLCNHHSREIGPQIEQKFPGTVFTKHGGNFEQSPAI